MKLKSLRPYSLLLLLFSISFFACKDQEDLSNYEVIPFTGISLTDLNGTPMNTPDLDDWKLNDCWLATEAALFNETDPNCPGDTLQEVYAAYPNPTAELFSITFRNTAVSDFKFRLVDKSFQVVKSYNFPQVPEGINDFRFNFSDISTNGILRLYYKVTQGDCSYKGHGDILFTL